MTDNTIKTLNSISSTFDWLTGLAGGLNNLDTRDAGIIRETKREIIELRQALEAKQELNNKTSLASTIYQGEKNGCVSILGDAPDDLLSKIHNVVSEYYGVGEPLEFETKQDTTMPDILYVHHHLDDGHTGEHFIEHDPLDHESFSEAVKYVRADKKQGDVEGLKEVGKILEAIEHQSVYCLNKSPIQQDIIDRVRRAIKVLPQQPKESE